MICMNLRSTVLALVVLLCAACQGGTPNSSMDDAPAAAEAQQPLASATAKPDSMSFQVDPTSELFVPAQAAAADWSVALGRNVTVTEDGELPILRVDGNCSSDTSSAYFTVACAKDIRTTDARIEVSSRAANWELYTALKHEMGHQLAGNSRHVENVPDALMYYYKPLGSPNVITSDDLLYVCKGFGGDGCSE